MEYLLPWWWSYALDVNGYMLLSACCLAAAKFYTGIVLIEAYERNCYLRAKQRELEDISHDSNVHDHFADRFRDSVIHCKYIVEKDWSEQYSWRPYFFVVRERA